MRIVLVEIKTHSSKQAGRIFLPLTPRPAKTDPSGVPPLGSFL